MKTALGNVGLLIGLAMVGWTSLAQGQDAKPAAATPAPAPTPASIAFDKLKTLAGEWVDSADPKAGVKVIYRVVSGGSVVMENLLPGTPHEMVTMYHLDGANLVLTHYCAVGNQPSMKWIPGKDPNILKFDFTNGSNMKPEDMHMHSATLDLSNPTKIKAVWTSWVGGKPQEPHTFEHIRKPA